MEPEVPWWQAEPDAQEVAMADQMQADAGSAATMLVACYLSFCEDGNNGNEMGAAVSHMVFTRQVQELVALEGDAVTPAFAFLCHLIYGMVMKRHNGDWAAVHAAAERGDLFFDNADDPDAVALRDLEKQLSEE